MTPEERLADRRADRKFIILYFTAIAILLVTFVWALGDLLDQPEPTGPVGEVYEIVHDGRTCIVYERERSSSIDCEDTP